MRVAGVGKRMECGYDLRGTYHFKSKSDSGTGRQPRST